MRGKSVLIVEDDEQVAGMYKMILEERGANVEVQKTLIQGAIAYGQRRHDVVLLDLVLPDSPKDDLEPINLFMAFNPSPAIVVMSGKIDDALELECIRAGAVNVIRKGDQATATEYFLRTLRKAGEMNDARIKPRKPAAETTARLESLLKRAGDLVGYDSKEQPTLRK